MRSEGGFVSRMDLFTQLCTLLCILSYFSGTVNAQDQTAQQMAPMASAQRRAVVTVNANLRAQPSMQGPILSVLQAETVVQTLSKSGSWEHVQTQSGTFGLIHTSLLVPLQIVDILQTASALAPASASQHRPNEQQAAVPGTGQSASQPPPVLKKPLIFPAPDPRLQTERAEYAQRAPLPPAKREILLGPDSSADTDGTGGTVSAPLPPARREILLGPDSSTDTVQPIFPEANISTPRLEDLDTSASADADEVSENTNEDDAGGLFGGSRLLYILAAFVVGALGILVFQIKKAWEIKQHIYVFEQNTRYPTLAWQPGDDLKPFLPPIQAERPLEAEQTDQDVQDITFEYQEDPVLQQAEAALTGQDQDMQETAEENFIDSLFFETVEEDSQTASQTDSQADYPTDSLTAPQVNSCATQPVELLEPQSYDYAQASPEKESSSFPPLLDLPAEFSAPEKAVLEAIFTQEEIPEYELKDMLDKRGFPGMLLKAVVGDLIRKTGSDGLPWIRVHYTQGVFRYQLQHVHLPTPPNGLGVANYVNGQEHSTNG